jgi:exopolysaccharide biosynthesis polyprenyl glycosylphosphotransferase
MDSAPVLASSATPQPYQHTTSLAVNTNGILQKHWLHVAAHFVTDSVLLFVAFTVAAFLRFGDEAQGSLWMHWPSLVLGGLAFSAALYIAGLYSTHSGSRGPFERGLVLTGCVGLAALVIVGSSYTGYVKPLGRGVMMLGTVITLGLSYAHHLRLLHVLRTSRERVLYIVASAFDEVETRLFQDFKSRNLEFVGVVSAGDYQPSGNSRVLGSVGDLREIARRERIERVLCTAKSLGNSALTRYFCQLRYSGISVMPLIIMCEEVNQRVPLELITHDWLLAASGEPHLLYIKKVKRLFDIVASLVGLVLGTPLVGLAAIAIKLTSPGPAFYRQLRAGRFGRPFTMTKLRSMRTGAEKEGARWSSADGRDDRVTWVGRFLRRYRIDEIPQLWQVLCGNMSFVGPRPERPEIIQRLAEEIPYFEERLMVQPGITGWAQVNYPYGASTLDARRKLEFDLYYLKHMSVFLDVFILLDTVRIILRGGVPASSQQDAASTTMAEWERAKAAETGDAPLKLETA